MDTPPVPIPAPAPISSEHPQPLSTEHTTSRVLPPSVKTQIWRDSVASKLFGETEQSPTWTPSLTDLMYLRFGFIEGANGLRIDPPSLSWIEVLRTFGRNDNEPQMDIKLFPFAVIQFLEPLGRRIVEKPANMVKLPVSLTEIQLPPWNIWDLSDKHIHRLSNISSLQTHIVMLDKRPVYELAVSAPGKTPWRLVVDHAATVVFSMRSRWGGKRLEVLVMHLVELGIPFQTLLQRPQAPTRTIRYIDTYVEVGVCDRQFQGLGTREQSWEAGLDDYAVYIYRREAFLQTPRCRAALLRGGIVWRLAMESHNLAVAADGPSETVSDFGRCFQGDDGESYWDDWLTDEEVDLICGVYMCKTNSNQISPKSWWPRPGVFEKSGLWTGYWTPACEEWFCHRRDKIRRKASYPLNSRDWKQALTMSKRARWVSAANEFLSAHFLEQHNF